MAIQMRRGVYGRFDPSRLVPGEYAIVLEGDPIAMDGMAVYMCFAAGTVKRLATYEDMADFFAAVKVDTVEWIVDTANAGFKAEYIEIRDSAKAAEAERVANELVRVGNEATRVSNEASRVEAESARAEAESLRIITIAEFEQDVADGLFDGATFTPSVSSDGLLSWTNDKGLPNPVTVDVSGPKGSDGVVTSIDAGMYMFQIVDGRLRVYYDDGADVPDMEIEDGHLRVLVG